MKNLVRSIVFFLAFLSASAHAESLLIGDSRMLFMSVYVEDSVEMSLIGESSTTIRNALQDELDANTYDACVIWAGINDCWIYNKCDGPWPGRTLRELKGMAADCRHTGIPPWRIFILTNTPIALGGDEVAEAFAVDSIPPESPALFRILDLHDVFDESHPWCDYTKTNDGPGVCLHPTLDGTALIGAAIEAALAE